ncbi:uncharacterized protein LOC133186833 isoform X2 [Saccostrea echinata]|uniref:uncharacterized protein LOC133186833 isoform X2 n=1 Tax=Saccostrea echinata TaxID=191078 RepID=UPI002A7F57D5|nr:uncharacterized protein LOC133186833 isoform X2 [Saccostrea echinata]
MAYGFQMDGITPYMGSDFEVNPTLYEPWADSEQMEDFLIEKLVGRVILASIQDKASEEDGRLMTHEEASNDLKRIQSPSNNKQRNAHNQKQEKRSKKGRKEEKECGVTIKTPHPIYPRLNLSLPNFRYMVISEVESRARAVHDYYAHQWYGVMEDRVRRYADLIRSLEREKRLEEKLQQALDEIHQQQKENEILKTEIENIKKSRKQRRKDAKLRRIRDLHGEGELTDLMMDDQKEEKHHEGEVTCKDRNKDKAYNQQKGVGNENGGVGEGSKKKKKNRKRRKSRAETNGGSGSDLLDPRVESTEKANICNKNQQYDVRKPEIDSLMETVIKNNNKENRGLESEKSRSVGPEKELATRDQKCSSEQLKTMEAVISKMIEKLSKTTVTGRVNDEEKEGTFYSGEPVQATFEKSESKPKGLCTSKKLQTGNGDENATEAGNVDENMATALYE